MTGSTSETDAQADRHRPTTFGPFQTLTARPAAVVPIGAAMIVGRLRVGRLVPHS